MWQNGSDDPWRSVRGKAKLVLKNYPEVLLLSVAFSFLLVWQEPSARTLPSLRDLPSAPAAERRTFLKLHGLEESPKPLLPVEILGLERARARWVF